VTERILITGAAGKIGSLLRRSLRRSDRFLVLLDVAAQPDLDPGEPAALIVASITDQEAMDRACVDVDVVIHLGGISGGGATWDEYVNVNVNGTHVVLEAARRAGVSKVVVASSNHAVGFHRIIEGETVPDYLFARPDSYYGVSKVVGESLGSLYHDRYGMDVLCLRIGSYLEIPTASRNLWSWLSPGDCVRLFEASIAAPGAGFRVVWGVSANARGIVSLEEGFAIGYVPQDDAETYAGQLDGSPGSDASWAGEFIGGPFTAPRFDHDA
jgi:hypothetical protein